MFTTVKETRSLTINVEDETLKQLLYDWQHDIIRKYNNCNDSNFQLLEELLYHIGFEGTALVYPAEDKDRPEEMYIKTTNYEGTITTEKIIVNYLAEDNVPVIILENRHKLYCVEVKKCVDSDKLYIILDGHPTVYVK